jgi:acetyl esterase/lipase
MRLTPLLLLALLLVAAQDTPGQRLAATVPINANARGKPTVMDGVRVRFPGGVSGVSGVTYAQPKGYRPLTLDLYLPPDAKPHPVIVVIHGGGWIFGSPRRTAAFADWPATLASIARQGYVVAAVSYRFASEAPFPAALQDIKSAVRWLRAHARGYAIDTDRFVTWGDSAGGQLSAMMAVTCNVAELEPAKDGWGADMAPPATPQSDCVQGAVAWYGAYDFTRPIGGPIPIEQHPYFGCLTTPCERAKLVAPSAAAYVDSADPPILLVHGTADASAPFAQSEHFLSVLKAAGVKARLAPIAGADHGWIGKTPAETQAMSREALALSVDFTRQVVGN